MFVRSALRSLRNSPATSRGGCGRRAGTDLAAAGSRRLFAAARSPVALVATQQREQQNQNENQRQASQLGHGHPSAAATSTSKLSKPMLNGVGSLVFLSAVAGTAGAEVVEPVVAAVAALPWYEAYTATGFTAQLISVAPLGFFFGLQMAPMKTMKQIMANQSTGAMSPMPYVTLFTNCVVWTSYGLMNSDPTLIAANGMGALLSAYYTYVFASHTQQQMSQYYIGGAGYLALTATGAMVLGENANLFVGLSGNLIAMMFFASPLAVIKTVIKEKSTEAMPFAVSAFTLANCMAWSSYGTFVAHDLMVVCPNLIGMGLAMFQLSLFGRFGFPSPKKDQRTV